MEQQVLWTFLDYTLLWFKVSWDSQTYSPIQIGSTSKRPKGCGNASLEIALSFVLFFFKPHSV